MPTIEENNNGSYKEPFVLPDYGCFVTKIDGRKSFIATGISPRDARNKAESYYRHMSANPKNNMDMTDLDRIEVKVRPVTYGLWRSCEDEPDEV